MTRWMSESMDELAVVECKLESLMVCELSLSG